MFSLYVELQITVCGFCQSSELTSPPNTPKTPLSGYQDGLFLLNPDEKPLCAADALLIFCIDISGSMSLTSQVKKHTTDTDLFTLGWHSQIQLVMFQPINLCDFKLSEGEHVVHKSRLQVSFFLIFKCPSEFVRLIMNINLNKLKVYHDHQCWYK